MTPDLNVPEVVAWMRKQATRCNEIAEELESTFSLNGHRSPGDVVKSGIAVAYAAHGNMRPSTDIEE